MLFDRLEVEAGRSILIIGAAGGVGSIMVQLARQLTNLVVVGTASRLESRQWLSTMGAHHVIDHTKPLADQLKSIGIPQVDYVASLTHTEQYFSQIVDVLLPQGKVGLIDDPATPLDVSKLKRKSLSLHWELMFTRSLFETPDMIKQHELLNEVAKLVDAGTIRTTLSQALDGINAVNLRKAHALIESGQARGKIVLEGF
jgi:zinc-binding alcohol dehydrogenase family protein